MTGEFPQIEQTFTERKEILERERPWVLSGILFYILTREVNNRQVFYSQSGDPEALAEIRMLASLDVKTVAERLARETKGENRIETIALLDVGELEYESLIGLFSTALSNAEEDSDEAEGLERMIERFGARQEKVRLERDWMLEEEPALRIFASRDEFLDWVRDLRARSEYRRRVVKSKNPEGARDQKLQEDVLRKIEAGGTLSFPEANLLNLLLELEINRTRLLASAEITKYLLNSPSYDRNQLLDYEKKIIKIRQFLVNVHSGEWVSIAKKK